MEEYKEKIIKIAKELEQIRVEIYQKADQEEDREYFNHINDLLFKTQSKLNYDIAEGVELLNYKKF